jgi:hypothetical protein
MKLFRINDVSGLGDHVCATAAFKNYYKKHKEKFYVWCAYPEIFELEDYTINTFKWRRHQYFNYNNFFNSFDEIINCTPMSTEFYQGKKHIVESFCDDLKVDKEFQPEYSILDREINNFIFPEKKYILTNLIANNKTALDWETDGYEFNKYYTYKNYVNLKNILEKTFKDYLFIELSDLKGVKNKRDLLILATKAKTFISVDTALMHICSNKKYFVKGLCLWNYENNIKQFGYTSQINLISKVTELSPYFETEFIVEQLEKILKNG